MRITLLVILSVLLSGCNQIDKIKSNINEKKRVRDSLAVIKKERLDSIHAVYDSIAAKRRAEEAAEEAYRNRPWKLNTFVDEFGDPTDIKYIRYTTTGKFSNSATSNEYLYVEIYIKNNAAGLFLHEYSSSRPAETFIGTGTMKLKNSAGAVLTIRMYDEWNQKGGMAIYRDYYYNLIYFLKKSVGEIKAVVQDEYSSSYSFTIDATGFTAEYNQL